MVKAGPVTGVADIHAWPLADGLQPLQHLDAACVVIVGVPLIAFLVCHLAPGLLYFALQMRMGITTYLNSFRPGTVTSMLLLASPKAHSTVSSCTLFNTSRR
ncbi:hypothetical protein D3C83_79650 [compost metagenome]